MEQWMRESLERRRLEYDAETERLKAKYADRLRDRENRSGNSCETPTSPSLEQSSQACVESWNKTVPNMLRLWEAQELRQSTCATCQAATNYGKCPLEDRKLYPGQEIYLETKDGKTKIAERMCKPVRQWNQAKTCREQGVPPRYLDKDWADYRTTKDNRRAISLVKAFLSKTVPEQFSPTDQDPTAPYSSKSTTPTGNVLTLPIQTASPKASPVSAEPSTPTSSTEPPRETPLKESFYICGGTGTGKTFLATLIAKALWQKRFFFRDMPDLLAELKGTFGKNNETYNFMTHCERASYLFLDDVGAGVISEWSVGVLYEIINTRYNHNLPVIVTSNYDLAGLKWRLGTGDKFSGARIVSRLTEMCNVVRLGEEDARCLL